MYNVEEIFEIMREGVRMGPIQIKELKEKGVRLIDEKPRCGAGGAKIAFLHPKATGGILLELSER